MIRHHNIGKSHPDRAGDLLPGYAALRLSPRRRRVIKASGLLIGAAGAALVVLVAFLLQS